MKYIRGGHFEFVIVAVMPPAKTDLWLASDEVFDEYRYWTGAEWSHYVKDAMTWDLISSAQDVADVLEGEGKIVVGKVFLETTIEFCGRVDE